MAKHNSLRLTLILSVVLPLVLAMTVAGYLALGALDRWTEARLQKEVELVARAVRMPLGHALERERQGTVDQILTSVFETNRVYSAYVYDVTGVPIAHRGKDDPEPPKRQLSRIAARGARTGEYIDVAGREVYSYFVPINDAGGQIIGLLQVTRRRSDIQEHMAAFRLPAAGAMTAALLLIVGLVLYGHHGAIGRHLTRLERSMERVSWGEREHRTTGGGPREIAALGLALNSMLDNIDEAEKELEEGREAQAALERRLRNTEKLAAIGQLAAGVAHELGAPLSVIAGKAQRAARREDLPAPIPGTLQTIRAEVQRMELIVRQLLDFSGTIDLQRSRVPADQLAQSAVAALGEEFPDVQERLRVAGLGPPPRLWIDAHQMEQVLRNLLRNAVQANHGGVVRLQWFAGDGEAGFVVEDEGPGVSAEVLPHLFEPFFTTKGTGQGTGLGLSVAHGVVERHGGRIEVGEGAGGGARFRVCIPEAAEHDGNDA